MNSDVLKIGLIYLEAMSIIGGLYESATHYAQRLRPLVYDEKSPLSERMSAASRKSFFGGHVALVGTSAFFMAEVYSQCHPDSRSKWIVDTVAGATTVVTGILRMEAGKHFFSDILTGTAVGTLTGTLVPSFHRSKWAKNGKLTIAPFGGFSNGLYARWKL